jgi:hypothetical protein
MSRHTVACAVLLLLISSPILCSGAEVINGHKVILDDTGKLLAWERPQGQAYDRVMRLAWDFLLDTVGVEENGLKTYYAYCCMDTKAGKGTAWPHNSAGLYAMLADSAAAYYAYSGDYRVVSLTRDLLDYQLAHGTTPANWLWGGVPYASSDHGATEYRGAFEFQYDKTLLGRGDGYGAVEPDKVAELGLGYLKFYKLTGSPLYREAALACVNALARNIRTGSAEKSPWPFRVYAETGFVREEYTANIVPAVRLLDEMIRLGMGNVVLYRKAREQAWSWILEYPMKNGVWSNYFEDVPIMPDLKNLNQYSPMETARYLMDQPEMYPDWQAQVSKLIAFVEKTFAVDYSKAGPNNEGNQWGANVISEQIHYMPKMGSHTSRYASILARWAELTGDNAAKDKAFRSFNWATYMCGETGIVNDQPSLHHAGIWFSDGYGDYIRHFMAGIGSVPEWAPAGQDHILRSSSIVTHVSYETSRIAYETFEKNAAEVIRLSFEPARVTAPGEKLEKRSDLSVPGWTFDAKAGVLRIRHEKSKNIEILAR